MNKPKNYIKLIYTPDGYRIFIVTETQKIHLSNKNAKIMYKTLKKFQYQQINDDVYIFQSFIPIMISFYKERKRSQKSKRVNRNKSKNIVVGSVLAVTLALAIGAIGSHNNQSKDPQINDTTISEDTKDEISSNDEIVINTIEKELENLNIYDDESINILFETENSEEEEVFQEEIIEEENNIDIKPETPNIDTEDFHYYYYEIGDQEALEKAKQYDSIFTKYESKYGIDKNLLCAIAAQESGGRQSASNCEKSFGLMAIERSQWENQTIEVYNFETQTYETITIDYNQVINNADYNIMVGSAIFQQYFYATVNSGLIIEEETLAYSVQRYNMGPKCMQEILKSGMHWIEGRKLVDIGDKRYFEHVFSRLENGTIINIQMPDGTNQSFSLTNDALELEPTHSKT